MAAGAEAPRPLAADNARVKQARRLARSRRLRDEVGQFVIESPGLIGDAVAAGVELDLILVPEGVEAPSHTGTTPVYSVPERTFRSISTTVTPQTALAVARHPTESTAVGTGLVVALADVGDPGNVGTMIRAAEAAGVSSVLLLGSTADPFGAKAVRASAGSAFRLPIAAVTISAFSDLVDDAGVDVWGATASGGSPPDEVDLTGAPVVILGNETRGIDPALGVEQWLTIPMAGGPESLNVAMAGTLIVFEAQRQRRNGRR